jgi:hypothetical protein
MKIMFLVLALVLAAVNAEQLLRDDEADERDGALSPFEVFEDIEDIEDRAAKKAKKSKKTKKTKKASTTGDDGDIQGIDERGDALAPFEVFEDIEDVEDRAAKKQKKSKKTKKTKKPSNTGAGDDGDIQGIDERGDALAVDDALAPVDALENRRLNPAYTKGDLVKLGTYYPKGIPFSVLFTFDTKFISMFGSKGMDTLITSVKKHYQDKSLKNGIGTTINVTGTKRKYTRTFKYTRPGTGDFPGNLQKDATKISTTLKKTFDAYIYVMGLSTNGGGGISIAGTVCNAQVKQRIGMVMGPMSTDSECEKGCTNAKRLSVLGRTAAHELGHILGMDHDFDTKAFNKGLRKGLRTYNYRKYKGKSCKGGLMSYAEPRSGWSTCGQRDLSRYLTSGGTKKPCTFGSKIKDNRKSCTSSCTTKFKGCVTQFKGMGAACSGAYGRCRQLLNGGDRVLLSGGCTKACKDTTKMTALKSSC